MTLERFVTYAAPEAHRRTFMKPFMTATVAEFCSACHKVHLDVPVNQLSLVPRIQRLRQLAGQRGFGAGRALVLLSGEAENCADCHMPLVAFERSGQSSTARSIRTASRERIRRCRTRTRTRSN